MFRERHLCIMWGIWCSLWYLFHDRELNTANPNSFHDSGTQATTIFPVGAVLSRSFSAGAGTHRASAMGSYYYLKPVPQKRFWSMFKFEQNIFIHIFSYIYLITKKLCTFQDSTAVLVGMLLVRIDTFSWRQWKKPVVTYNLDILLSHAPCWFSLLIG